MAVLRAARIAGTLANNNLGARTSETKIADPALKISVTDSGIGTDSVSAIPVQAFISISDSAVGSETFDITTKIPIFETATGSETFNFQAGVSINDSGTGDDILSIKAQLGLTDSASGIELAQSGQNVDKVIGSARIAEGRITESRIAET